MWKNAQIAAVALIVTWSSEGQSTERFEVASVRISPPTATGKPFWSDPCVRYSGLAHFDALIWPT